MNSGVLNGLNRAIWRETFIGGTQLPVDCVLCPFPPVGMTRRRDLTQHPSVSLMKSTHLLQSNSMSSSHPVIVKLEFEGSLRQFPGVLPFDDKKEASGIQAKS